MARKKKKVVSKRGRGTIAILTMLLLGSAALRLVSSADQVFAAGPSAEQIEEADKAESEDKQDFRPSDIGPIIQAFEAREAKVAEKERKIDIRMRALRISEERIEERIAALEKAEQNLRATMALADSAAENDLARLTAVYENMKPKVAAALFQEMDPEFAAGFLGRMRPNTAAAVLAGMPAEKAYSISAILAGRNANVPKN